MDRAEPSSTHDLGQAFCIIAVRLVELHAQRRSSMPGIKAGHIEISRAELMNEPRCHGTSLDADPRTRAGVLKHSVSNLLRGRDALPTPKSTTFAIDNAEHRGLL